LQKNIIIVGLGYVGLSNAVLLSQHNNVVAFDIDDSKVSMINNRKSPIEDKEILDFFSKKELSLKAEIYTENVLFDADYVVIATPTNYDEITNQFDTSGVESIIQNIINKNKEVSIIIKSTVPVGFTERMRKRFKSNKIIFSPEFLTEGSALYDNLHPSRIVIGDRGEEAKLFASLLQEGAIKKDIPIFLIKSSEAEACKLFSNTYLALRVAFFNELDTYALSHNLDTLSIIRSVCLDPRIGDYYNNPSFGYGGYCLPKDTKQLLKNYEDVPQKIIESIVSANSLRKDFIASEIIKEKPDSVGIYRLIMKEGSDNFRDSSMQGIVKRIKAKGIKLYIYEPLLTQKDFFGSTILENLKEFKSISDIILTNRIHSDLNDVQHKIFTRDLFGEN
jgi:UDPglucose 6-dehydrogenase